MRDLAGWFLSILLWTYPAIVLGTFVGWMDGKLYAYGFFFTVLAGLTWPGLYLLSRRLRQASDLDVAEADGRPPVLVLHGFERTKTPLWRRLLPGSAFVRDLADELLVRALRKSLEPAGPLITLSRPTPPPTHGPMAQLVSTAPAHEAELLMRARAAQLVVVVLDGSEAMRREIGLLADAIDLRRLILVVSPTSTQTLLEQWARFRQQLPGLPPLDPSTAAVRFDKDGSPTILGSAAPTAAARRQALSQPHLMLREPERVGAPRVPSWSWVLSSLPLGMAFLSTVLTPIFAREHDISISSGDSAGLAMFSVGLGVLLTISSRRVMRLVPGSELPLVLIAAAPWLVGELAAMQNAEEIWGVTRGIWLAGQGAAIAAPLLWATAILLAGASLMRRSPGRKKSFGLFGFAAVIPLLAYGLSLGAIHIDVGGLFLATLATGGALALATVAASGDAGRRHAPLSMGSAASATLALAAWATVVTHGGWHRAVSAAVNGDPSSQRYFAQGVGTLMEFDAAWAWFLLALPCVVLVGLLFSGRSSKTAARDAVTLLPLAALLTMAASSHARARVVLGERGLLEGVEGWAEAGGPDLLPGFELIAIREGDYVTGPIDVVIDRGGALANGHRVSSELEMASFGSMGSPGLSAAIGDRLRARDDRSEVNIAVAPDASGQALLTACRAAWAQGASDARIVGTTSYGDLGSVVARQHFVVYRRGGEEEILLYLFVRPDRVSLEGTEGSRIEIPHDHLGRIDDQTLGERLQERHSLEPNRRDITVVVAGGARARDVVTAIALARWAGFMDVSFDDHVL